MDDTVNLALIDAVISTAQSVRPDIGIGEKYGGTVFMTDLDTPASLLAGVFSYNNYVSVEFSKGAEFDDPHGVLEGKGKARRHVKLLQPADLDTKTVAGFLEQAFV